MESGSWQEELGERPWETSALGPQTLPRIGRGADREGKCRALETAKPRAAAKDDPGPSSPLTSPANLFSSRQPRDLLKINRIMLHTPALNLSMAPGCSQDKCKTPQVPSMRPQGPGPANLSTPASYRTHLTLHPARLAFRHTRTATVLRPQALAFPSAGDALPS